MSNYINTHTISLVPTRMVWMRLNRILAWAMIVSPLVQLIFRVSFEAGWPIDLGLLFAHGALSLVLFGVPKIKGRRFDGAMHVLGVRPEELSARNNFLLSGYRIALGMTPVLVTMLGLPWVLALPFLYPILRMPVSVIQHVDIAAQYATRRMGLRKAFSDFALPLYLLFSFINIYVDAFHPWS